MKKKLHEKSTSDNSNSLDITKYTTKFIHCSTVIREKSTKFFFKIWLILSTLSISAEIIPI